MQAAPCCWDSREALLAARNVLQWWQVPLRRRIRALRLCKGLYDAAEWQAALLLQRPWGDGDAWAQDLHAEHLDQ